MIIQSPSAFCELLKKCSKQTPNFKYFLRLQFLISWLRTFGADEPIIFYFSK